MADEIIATGRSEKSFVVSKKALSVATLFLFALSSTFLPSEVISALMFLWVSGAIISSGFKLHKGIVPLVVPFLIFIIFGLIGAYNNAPFEIFKDVWYTGKAVLSLIVGYLLMIKINDFKTMLRIFIFAAVISALYHLAYFIATPDLLLESVNTLREKAGKGYFIDVIAVAIIIACQRWKINLFPKMRWFTLFAVTLCLLSLVLAFSRTLWITLVAMLIVLMGFLNFKNMKRLVVVGAAAIILVLFVFSTPKNERIGTDVTLRGKLANSFKEMAVRNYVDIADINQNWRGYESFMALKSYLEGNTFQYFFGRGFGALVDIGIYMKLGEDYFRYIPTLHNGYLYILVKTGLAGMLVYLYFFASLIFFGKHFEASLDEDSRLAGFFLVSLSVAFILTTVVIAGLFNKIVMTPAVVMTGSVYACLKTRNKAIQSFIAKGGTT